jgi:DNA-binding LytR/AlgR family response regulator
LEDLIRQKEWIFKQNLDPQTITPVSKTRDLDKIPAQSEWVVLIGNQVEKIDMAKISHVNVEDHYCRIFVKEQAGYREFYVKISLKEILDQLPRDRFLQIHRSHIVNLAYVSSLIKDSRSYQLALDQGAHTLPISRYRLPQVLSRLEKLTT